MQVNLRYLVRDPDRHGNDRLYVKKQGCRKIRLRQPEGTPAFFAEYEAALKALGKPAPEPEPVGVRPGTLGWLVNEFELSHQFSRLDKRSQRVRHLVHEAILNGSPEPGSSHTFRDCPLDRFTSKFVRGLRDHKAATPGAANNWLSALRVLFSWGMEDREDYVFANPARDVKDLGYKTQGFHTWTLDEVAQFQKRHAPGSRAYLALSIMLFTGMRRSDAVAFGPATVKDGKISFTPRKTSTTSGKSLKLPLLAPLQAVMDVSQLGKKAFLETSHGKPFTSNGFGNWFRDRCDEAGLKHCTAHGLRKAGACIAAMNGATVNQLMEIFGWTTAKQAIEYTKDIDQEKVASGAMHLLIPPQTVNGSGT